MIEMFSQVIHFSIIPPVNSVVTCSACECQHTLPEWKVWLLAMIETVFIFSPAGAKSNFQLILPEEEPSVRAKYTWKMGERRKTKHFSVVLVVEVFLPNIIEREIFFGPKNISTDC